MASGVSIYNLKVMRNFIFIIFLFITKSSLSQVFTIIDSSGQKVAYATVEVLKKNIALFSDSSGMVNLSSYNLFAEDTIQISAIGYRELKIANKNIESKVTIQLVIRPLPPVFVYNGDLKSENWGSKKQKRVLFNSYYCGVDLIGPGNQIGRLIKPPDEKRGPAWIYKIAFFAQSKQPFGRNSETPVRLRVYTIDPLGFPASDLLTEVFVEKIKKANAWLEFDLSQSPIQLMDEGLIIAAEFFDTNPSNWHEERVRYMDSTGRMRTKTMKFYGASFGMNDEKNQGPTLIRRYGYWMFNARQIEDKCENLVIQIWVKYPKRSK